MKQATPTAEKDGGRMLTSLAAACQNRGSSGPSYLQLSVTRPNFSLRSLLTPDSNQTSLPPKQSRPPTPSLSLCISVFVFFLLLLVLSFKLTASFDDVSDPVGSVIKAYLLPHLAPPVATGATCTRCDGALLLPGWQRSLLRRAVFFRQRSREPLLP